jgi:hypothetical protein
VVSTAEKNTPAPADTVTDVSIVKKKHHASTAERRYPPSWLGHLGPSASA